jgi:uncharacterized damage-inducible protein DinB
MKTSQLLADVLARNLNMLKMTLADFSDADMLVRPAPAANHAAWQLGHLATAEHNLVNSAAPGTVPALPAGFADKFKKDASKSDDASQFPKKEEILSVIERNRKATIDWARGLSDADLERPSTNPLGGMCPRIADLVLLQADHLTMHIGQLQVIRRKLGKPVLF